MKPAPYALPLRIRKAAEAFVVEDAGGVALAYVYFEDDPSSARARQSAFRRRRQGSGADHRESADGGR